MSVLGTKYLDLDGDPVIMQVTKDGAAAWVKPEDQDWQDIKVIEVLYDGRELDEKTFKKRFPDAGLPEGLGK